MSIYNSNIYINESNDEIFASMKSDLIQKPNNLSAQCAKIVNQIALAPNKAYVSPQLLNNSRIKNIKPSMSNNKEFNFENINKSLFGLGKAKAPKVDSVLAKTKDGKYTGYSSGETLYLLSNMKFGGKSDLVYFRYAKNDPYSIFNDKVFNDCISIYSEFSGNAEYYMGQLFNVAINLDTISNADDLVTSTVSKEMLNNLKEVDIYQAYLQWSGAPTVIYSYIIDAEACGFANYGEGKKYYKYSFPALFFNPYTRKVYLSWYALENKDLKK